MEMKMIRTVIVESDRFTTKKLTKILTTNFSNLTIVAKATTVLEAIKYIQSLNPDLVFMDMQIQELNCSFIIDCLPNQKLKFILMSSNTADAINAIKWEAIYFITIPFKTDVIKQAIHKYTLANNDLETRQFHDRKLIVKNGNLEKILSVSEIIAIEAMRGYCKIILQDMTEIIVSKSMSSFIKHHSIENEFITIHKSHSVNFDYVDSVDKQTNCVILKNGCKYKIAERRIKTVFKTLKITIESKTTTLGNENHTNGKL